MCTLRDKCASPDPPLKRDTKKAGTLYECQSGFHRSIGGQSTSLYRPVQALEEF